MQPEPEDRLEDHYIRLGTRTPRCNAPFCDETDPRALVGVYPNVVCYEHQRLAQHKAWVEHHHVAGQHNDPSTVAIPGNDHRRLSDAQRDWPYTTLRNTDGSPLLRAAAALHGWLDLLQLIIERVAGWIPSYLEALDASLRTKLGTYWWKDFPPAGDAA